MTTSDARKRLTEAIDRLERVETATHAINPDTGEFIRLDQETDMTDNRIAAESLLDGELEDHADVSTLTSAAAHALLAIHDLLRDRLPEREVPECGDPSTAGRGWACTLPLGHDGPHYADPEWLAEPVPVPHPDDEADEALAKVLKAHHEDRRDWVYTARAAREHIEAEMDRRERTAVDEWDDMLARAEKAEADLARVTKERDVAVRLANCNADRAHDLEDRYKALREDIRTGDGRLLSASEAALSGWLLARDDARAEGQS